MNPPPKALSNITDKIAQLGANVRKDGFVLSITIDLSLAGGNLQKLRSSLYLMIKNFGNQYTITIEGAPYCLFPDVARHVLYKKNSAKQYRKEPTCASCKYSDQCPGWDTNHKISPLPSAVPNIPLEVVLEITKKCNLRCPLCFSTKSNKALPLTKIKAVIDECVDLGIHTVRFSGGEPLLHENIGEALYYAKAQGLYVILNTNATVLTKDTERAIRDCVDNCLVSFQGFNEESEQRLTQSPTDFKNKVHHVVKLNAQVPTFRLGTIISRTLVDHFDAYFRIVKKLGIRYWELYRPMLPSDENEFDIKQKDFLKIMERMKAIKEKKYDIKIANPLPFCLSEDLTLSQYVLLGAVADDGHSRIVYDPDGFFKPSYFISEDLGNSVKAAWHSPFLTKMRSLDYLPRKCLECSCLSWCKGGSRSLARIVNGNYFAPDPLMP